MEPKFSERQQQYQYDLAVEELKKDSHAWFLEIGSFTGNTARCYAQAIRDFGGRDNRLICVDPFYGHYDESLQKVLNEQGHAESSWCLFNRNLGDLIDCVIPIATTSKQAKSIIYQLTQRFAIVFIDGDHSEECARNDFDFAHSLLVNRGGIILVHDANWASVINPIKKTCEEFGLFISYVYDKALARIDIPL